MARLLIDTDVLIDVTRNDETAKVRLKKESLSATLCVSDITVLELVIGCRNNTEQQALQKFLAQFEVEPLTETI
jgi:predicted nucleic acid-binding protein